MRILTTCRVCGASVQTDDDQVPHDSDLFEELVLNLTDRDVRTDHVHLLSTEEL